MNREQWLNERRKNIPVEKLRALYESGLSQKEVAQELCCSQDYVFRYMKIHGIKARKAAKRNQRGSANANWVGDDICYKAAHQRVYAVRGRPNQCEHCKTTDLSKRYDWANKSGRYYDPYDYIRLCRSCHCKYDRLIRNLGNYANLKTNEK